MEVNILKKLSDYLKDVGFVENNLGKFTLGKQLGQGGTSIVREAILEGNSTYAIKFLTENIISKESRAYLRFKQSYINILSIQDTGVVLPQIHFDNIKIDKDTIIPYSIMLKADKTLKDIVFKEEMTYERFEKIFKSLVTIIGVIHKYNIIHRDLKPENIFLINKKLVLGDFDIAKFNDAEHIKFYETKSNERLANYQFSAPEQSVKKFEEIDERADLFALGQILYWLITKTTLRGQESINLKNYDTRYRKYEELITKLLQNERDSRFLNVGEIEQFLKQKDRHRQEQKEISKSFKTLRLFDEIIDKYAYDKRCQSFKKIENKDLINEIMTDLSSQFRQMRLWWSQGLGDNEIEKIEKYESLSLKERVIDKCIKSTKWIVDYFEFSIKSIWIYKYGDVGGSVIIIETEPLKSFGIYNEKYDSEEVAVFKDKYISRRHYDNGWTEINGKKVRIDSPCEIRIRHLYSDLFFIAPYDGSIIANDQTRTELILLDIYDKHKAGTPLSESLLAPIKEFRRKSKIALWS
ncbi:protein kinase [Arcobacter sp. YIC-80]|uniref:protein kinase domain-containing protein n=1 Tax=Arcobacter sp. YIC-80 TaxID=3376683 RepID=UPI00384DFD5C